MAAAKTPAKPKTKPKAEVPKVETFELDGPVYVWNVTDDPEKDRPFSSMVVPFGYLKRLIYVREYDYEKLGGWQRKTTKAHVRALLEAIKDDTYTPTTWEVAIEDWHLNRLKYSEPTEEGGPRWVKVTATTDRKLPLPDANHRRQALELFFAEAQGDEDLMRRIDALPINIKLSLSPKHLPQDFLNFQKGKAASRNLVKSMSIASGDYDDEKLPVVKHATETVHLLAKDTRSHLGNFVTFDEAAMNKVQYASLIADNSSSLATTVYGGSLIAMHFERSPEWLAERYVQAYQLLEERGEPSDPANPNSEKRLFMPGSALSPTSKGGTRYGSHMICGIANCFAWRLAAIGMDDDPIDEELQRMVEHASLVFDRELEGTSAEDKRRDMYKFAKSYFSDMFRKDQPLKKPDGEFFEKVDGVPAELIEILSASTLGVDKGRWKAYKQQKDGVPAKKPGRPRKPRKPESETEES